MVGRFQKTLAGVVAALVLAAPVWFAPAWAAGPEPHRVVAVGDLHGDYEAWRAIAWDAGLIDAKGRWAGGPTVFVQTGDIVDRGPASLKIIQDLMRLQREAPRKGGKVVTLVGNHEAMNLTGDLRYVSAGEFASYADKQSAKRRARAFAANKPAIEAAYRQRDPAMTPEAIKQAWIAATPLGQIEHQTAWRPDGKIGRWIVGNPAVAEVGGSLFVHGGIGPAYATVPLDEINRQVAAALQGSMTARDAIINDPRGPLWYRGLATPDPAGGDPPVAAQLDQMLAAQGAKRIVIGHTPILTGIEISEDGRLVRIDTGISAAYRGKVAWLEILDGALIPHTIDRPQGSEGAK